MENGKLAPRAQLAAFASWQETKMESAKVAATANNNNNNNSNDEHNNKSQIKFRIIFLAVCCFYRFLFLGHKVFCFCGLAWTFFWGFSAVLFSCQPHVAFGFICCSGAVFLCISFDEKSLLLQSYARTWTKYAFPYCEFPSHLLAQSQHPRRKLPQTPVGQSSSHSCSTNQKWPNEPHESN